MQILWNTGVCILFVGWLCLTVMKSLERGQRFLARLGISGQLLPAWNFFAPLPNTFDCFLLYRDKDVLGNVGSWREAGGFNRPRDWTAFLWNTEKLANKTFYDLVQALENPAEFPMDDPVKRQFIKLSIPYLYLLNYVSNFDHPPTSTATQFLVMRRDKIAGTTAPATLSGFHDLS